MIYFHPRIVENYAVGHFRIFNMQRLLALRPVGMILYKRLFLTFGYLKRQGVEIGACASRRTTRRSAATGSVGHRPGL